MIIMGYPGIGKTTVSKDDYRFIDLDSDAFKHRGLFRDKNWAEHYCNTALFLSGQGYCVFVSTHPEVRRKIISMEPCSVLCYPHIELKEDWIRRLHERYDGMRNRQTHNAWRRAADFYESDIQELMACSACRNHIILSSMDYNLKRVILEHGEYFTSQTWRYRP